MMDKLDPETIQGDYNEAYQRWNQHFDKNRESIEECFKETACVPFEPVFDPGIKAPNWKALTENLKECQKIVKELLKKCS